MKPAERFARNLRALRESKGLSQEAVGDAAGLHFTQVSRYERGVHEPGVTVIVNLARALGVRPSQLFDGFE
ncbi:helix-turn-helix domain-containing protein [Conexibacter sp. SYSU D00693]|uniref:helix-turn-helix domain-containing protein n=1 Tax=Conexibacter sp. SYSU D00693 TaxID=2812560 RepID=UPI00196A7EDF|nr:helix-turn-helix transcriptional regulator [Conexibacter sp. SYSU D00693]